jgi:hypothetical protein
MKHRQVVITYFKIKEIYEIFKTFFSKNIEVVESSKPSKSRQDITK